MAPEPPRRRSWLRRLFGLAVFGTLLLVVLYFIVTSTAFFQFVVLPKIGQEFESDLHVGDARIRPTQATLRDLSVRFGTEPPWLTAKQVRLRYSLRSLLQGSWHLSDFSLVEPTFNFIKHDDGTSNLGPLLARLKDAWPSLNNSQPSAHYVQRLHITDGQMYLTAETTGGKERTIAVHDITWNLNNTTRGQAGTIDFIGRILLNSRWTLDEAPELEAGVESKFAFEFADKRKPLLLQGRTELAVNNAQGGLVQLEQVQSAIECQITPTEIQQLLCSFTQHGTNLGVIQLNGPFDLAAQRGDLQFLAHAVDPRLLRLFGWQTGLDFAWLQSTNRLQIRSNEVAVIGRTSLTDLSWTRGSNRISQALALLDLNVWAQNQAQMVTGVLNLPDLSGQLGGRALTNLAGSLAFEISNHLQQTEIRRFDFSLPITSRASNQGQLRGHIDRSDPAGWQGQLAFTTDSLDLTPFLAASPPIEPAPPADSPPADSPAPFIPAPPKPKSRPVKQVTTEFRVGQLHFDTLNLSNATAQLVLEKERTALRQGTGILNGGRLTIEAELGATSLGTNFTGSTEISLANASLRTTYLDSFLTPIASALHSAELAQDPLTDLKLEAKAADGQLEFHQCRLRSKLFTLETQGVLPVTEPLCQSLFPHWPVRLAIHPTLASRLQFTSLSSIGGYTVLPSFIRLGGTLAQPIAHIDNGIIKVPEVSN